MNAGDAATPVLDRQVLGLFMELHGHYARDQLARAIAGDIGQLRAGSERLASAIADGQLEAARPPAHDLTGLAATYGLQRLSYLAESLGQACRASDGAAAREACGRLVETLRASLERLEAELAGDYGIALE